jgi:nucleoside-diphosphate-sugar epimerase
VHRYADRIRPSAGVIHLASARGDTRAAVAEDVLATRSIVAAWTHGPFIYPSHATVYGVPEGSPLTEDHPSRPSHWYDLGKVASEEDLRSAALVGDRGPSIILRPSLIFATNDRRADRQFFSWIYTTSPVASAAGER